MKKTHLLFFILIVFALQGQKNLLGQNFTERLLWTDTSGSLEIEKNTFNFSFDREGNFCFRVKKSGDDWIITNNSTLDKLCPAGAGFGKHGGCEYFRSCAQKYANYVYAKNQDGTTIYGPITGTVQGYHTGHTRQHCAVTSVLGDTAFFYLDGRMVYSTLLENIKQFKLSNEDWVDFSENGNVIYFLEQNNRFVLYVNDLPIDSSDFRFYSLSINDKGDYIYAKGFRPEQPIGKYDYMFFIHTKDTALDYVRTTWNYALTGNGAYYFSGDDNGPYYIAINGRLHRDIESIRNIILLDNKNSFYTFKKKNKLFLNVNGVDYPVDFKEIYYPSMDTNGHFAYFGMKNYFLYKVVDGNVSKKPLAKYGVMAEPMHISADGHTLYYFKAIDSIYVYQDNDLILKPIKSKEPIELMPWDDVIHCWSYYKKPANGHSLLCLNYGNQGYFVHDGKLSEALLPLTLWSSWGIEPVVGCIVEGVFNENGFFAIQYTGEKQYVLMVNGLVYKELQGIDKIIPDKGFFDGNRVIFYGIKNHDIYQFILAL